MELAHYSLGYKLKGPIIFRNEEFEMQFELMHFETLEPSTNCSAFLTKDMFEIAYEKAKALTV